jgi:hypothetical protein
VAFGAVLIDEGLDCFLEDLPGIGPQSGLVGQVITGLRPTRRDQEQDQSQSDHNVRVEGLLGHG